MSAQSFDVKHFFECASAVIVANRKGKMTSRNAAYNPGFWGAKKGEEPWVSADHE